MMLCYICGNYSGKLKTQKVKNNCKNVLGFEHYTGLQMRCTCLRNHAIYACIILCIMVYVNVRIIKPFPSVFSGRADKSSVRSSQMSSRTPPSFTRTPSRRYQRRIVEGANDSECSRTRVFCYFFFFFQNVSSPIFPPPMSLISDLSSL